MLSNISGYIPMKHSKSFLLSAAFLLIMPALYAVPIEDKSSDEILSEVRISRIPKIIEILEEKGLRALDLENYNDAKEFLQKSLVLRNAIGMKQTEGSAQILAKVSSIESKLGNQCEATKLGRLAKRIYRQIGVNFGAVQFEEPPTKVAQVSCNDTITWLKD